MQMHKGVANPFAIDYRIFMTQQRGNKNTGNTEQAETIHIKKYGNSRLYSSAETRFVTIDELAAVVRSGKKVKVTDADTNEDITAEILTQILLENGRAQHFPVEMLEQMIRLNEQALGSFWSNYLDQSMRMFESFQQNLKMLQSANPFFQWMAGGANSPQMTPSDEDSEPKSKKRPASSRRNPK
jgi:polyhydroxyalkanoate synthesis repressor PhaR